MTRFRLGKLLVDLGGKALLGPDAKTPLTDRECALLAYLAARPGQVVDRDTLLREVWGFRPGVRTRAIDHATRRLRQKLEPDPRHPVHLRSRYGQGLMLVGIETVGGPGGTIPPRPAGRLRGREHLQSAAQAHLGQGGRWLSLVGPAGIGKSRLALELAHARQDAQGAVAWFDLEGVGSVGQASAKLSALLGHSHTDAPPEFHAITRAGLDLVVLDGLDCAPAGLEAELNGWLQGHPGLQILLTRRAPVHAQAEHILALGPLAPAAARGLLLSAAERHGVRASRGQLRPGSTEEAGLHQLVQRLDGIPLALELAGARLRTLSPAQLAERLGRPELADPLGSAGPGSALEAALGRSWAALTPDQRRLLGLLCGCAGPMEASQAQRLWHHAGAPGSVLAALDGLLNQSLLRTQQGPHGPQHGPYTPVRWFVNSQPDPGRAAAQIAHGQWALELPAAQAVGELELAAERPLPPALAGACAMAWAQAVRHGGPHTRCLAALADAAAGLPPGPQRAQLHLWEVRLHRGAGRLAQARAALRQVALADAAGADPDIVLEQAWVLLLGGRPAAADALATEVLAGSALPTRTQAQAWHIRANAAWVEQDFRRSQQGNRRARDLYQRAGDAHGEARALGNLALMARDRGRSTEARARLNDLLALAERAGDRPVAAQATSALAVLEVFAGNVPAAEATAQAACTQFRRLGNRRGEGSLWATLSMAYLGAGDDAQADALLQQAGACLHDVGDARLTLLVDGIEGLAALCQGRFADSAQGLGHAVAALRGRGLDALADPLAPFLPLAQARAGHAQRTEAPAPKPGEERLLHQLVAQAMSGAQPSALPPKLAGPLAPLIRIAHRLATT